MILSGQYSAIKDDQDYDFEKDENVAKWRGIFANSLPKILDEMHKNMEAKTEALYHVESLCLRVLGMLCAKPPPHTIQDIEHRVSNFPNPIDSWAIKQAHEAIDKNLKKKKPALPIDKIHTMLQKEVLQYKIDYQVTMFLVGVLEYLASDIFNVAGKYVKEMKLMSITKEDVEIAMRADKALVDLFYQDNVTVDDKVLVQPTPMTKLSYEELVKALIHDEKQYLRDLNMIIRVFREELMKIVNDPKELDPIFSNIFDIYEITITLLGSLEDVIEMSQEEVPCVGSCFEDLAEAAEFNVYISYIREVTSSESKEALQNLLAKPEAGKLLSAGHGFPEAVKYYLPKLLLVPIWHGCLYFDYIKMFLHLSTVQEDRESFEQVEGLLQPLQIELQNVIKLIPKEPRMTTSNKLHFTQKDLESNSNDRNHTLDNMKLLHFFIPKNVARERRATPVENFGTIQEIQAISTYLPIDSRLHSRIRRQYAIDKLKKLQATVEHWDKDVGQCCNEFIHEDTLQKLSSGKRITERKVYLFDGLLVLCKANTRRQTVSMGPTTTYDFRLKERFFMRKVEIIDRPDTDEVKHSFEIAPRAQPPVILLAKSMQHKSDWMADLIMVNTKSMLDRILDSILLDIEKKHPLRLPSSELYKFAVPDSDKNIVLEEREGAGVPLIKGASLLKLVERLTYNVYADPMFVRTFLTTYRSFCSPQELLELLIERYSIPEPNLVYEYGNDKETGLETDKIHKSSQREDWKRYKKEYMQPIQFRVINVIRHWVDNHFYDFERDPDLLNKLNQFLDSINGKAMRKWIESVTKTVKRKTQLSDAQPPVTYAFNNSPPEIEQHLTISHREYNLLVLHPVELARQLTLLEFELYKNVKPSELVGTVWTKKDKEITSPNLLRIIKHTTNFTRWLEKSIVEAENYEERAAIVIRAIEIMCVLLELNNFNGVLSVVSAMDSASVYRLKWTFQMVPDRLKKCLDDCRDLNKDHFRKYQEKLRSINPPCVPFFGMYLTNILHIEEGNPDCLPKTELINFSKRRKVAEITGEIQQYQNQPYCLSEDKKMRLFLEHLDPFNGLSDTEISNILYEQSLRIEPRKCRQPPKFPRRWPDLTLKSPGIKAQKSRTASNSSTQSSSQMNPKTPHSDAISIDSRMSDNISEAGCELNHGYAGSTTSLLAPEIPKRSNSISSLTSNHSFMSNRFFPPGLNETTSPTGGQLERLVEENGWADKYEREPSPSPRNTRIMYNLPFSNRSRMTDDILSVDHPPTSYPPSPLIYQEQQQSHYDQSEPTPIPISPHVNVPSSSSSVTHVAPPPPLPPRRREKKESEAADWAQKKQAPDAPQLPPRDLSPPPLPPRLSLSNFPKKPIVTQFLNTARDEPPQLPPQHNLQPPITSTIMKRRNSALENASGKNTKSPAPINTSATSPPVLSIQKPIVPNVSVPSRGTQQQISPLLCEKPKSPSLFNKIRQKKPFSGSNTSPQLSSGETTPKLPPKPKTANLTLSSMNDKTMFIYPSPTNSNPE